MNNKENTQHIAQLKDNTIDVTQIIGQVYEALTEKGYNPVSQLVGYIMRVILHISPAIRMQEV